MPQTPIKVIALSDAEEETLIINKGFVRLLSKCSQQDKFCVLSPV